MRQSLVGLTAFFMLVSAAVAKKPAGQQNPTPAPPKAQRVAYAWQSSQGTPMPPPPMKDQQSSQYTPPAQEQSAPNAGSKTVPDDQQQQPSPSPTMPPPGTPPPSTQNQQAWPRPNVGVETPPDDRRPSTDGSQPAPPASRQVTLPAGTRVLLQLQSPIYTKTARVGDGVYCESTFPVTQENQMAIPAGTYVKGRITHIQRPGRIKGRAELQVHFTSMVFPNGYTVDLPGTLEGTPGSYNHQVTDEEGTVKANGTKGRDVGTVASTTGAGAVIGGLASRSGSGAGIGAGVGAAVGLAQVLLTRGPDVRLERGTALEMVLQTPLTVEVPPNYDNYQSRRNFMPPSDVRPRPVRRRRMGYGYPPMPPPPPPEN